MGYNYKAIVDAELWPSFAAFDEALSRDPSGVRLVGPIAYSDTPLACGEEEELAVRVGGGREFIIEARDYIYDEANDIVELKASMLIDGMDVSRLDGGHVFSVTCHENGDDWRAAVGLLRVMVRDFGGYGLDFQSRSFGTGDWANAIEPLIVKDHADYDVLVAKIHAEAQVPLNARQHQRRLLYRLATLFRQRP